MPWLQLHSQVTRDQAEAVEDCLLACGAVSVTLTDNADNPILEPGVGETPLWETIRLTGLFEVTTEQSVVEEQLCVNFPALSDSITWETVEDQPWERAWMEHFEPIQCGQRLWICPSWREPPDSTAINLKLDPGLAFGSGTHPTTFMCLKWLDSLGELTGKTVVDYGCGSGILGIAALLLGADKVIAVDNDPQALIASRDNLKRNNLEDHRLITCFPQDVPHIRADIVLANILAGPLIELANILSGLCAEQGKICLSGITTEQVGPVIGAYPDFVLNATSQEEWVRLAGDKPPTD